MYNTSTIRLLHIKTNAQTMVSCLQFAATYIYRTGCKAPSGELNKSKINPFSPVILLLLFNDKRAKIKLYKQIIQNNENMHSRRYRH